MKESERYRAKIDGRSTEEVYEKCISTSSVLTEEVCEWGATCMEISAWAGVQHKNLHTDDHVSTHKVPLWTSIHQHATYIRFICQHRTYHVPTSMHQHTTYLLRMRIHQHTTYRRVTTVRQHVTYRRSTTVCQHTTYCMRTSIHQHKTYRRETTVHQHTTYVS